MRKGEPVPPQKEVEYSSPLCSHHELFSLISTCKGIEADSAINEFLFQMTLQISWARALSLLPIDVHNVFSVLQVTDDHMADLAANIKVRFSTNSCEHQLLRVPLINFFNFILRPIMYIQDY